MKKKITGIALSLFASASISAPVFCLTALDDTKVFLKQNEIRFISYKIHNQSIKAHTLVLRKMVGISQIEDKNTCCENQRLLPNQSCILKLKIDGSTFNGLDDRAPRVCVDSSALECYTPTDAQELKVTVL